jgi:VanZ family protein
MATIFVLSSIPRVPGASVVPDWVTHGIAYGVGAVLIARALDGGSPRLSGRVSVAAVALATAYGVTDEYHQSFVPGRQAEVADVVKDFGGAAVFTFLRFRRRAAPERLRAPEVHP